MELFPITNDTDHDRAVREIARLWDAEPGTPEEAYMDALATLVDRYEAARWPIEAASAAEVIRFVMDQNGYTQTDLAKVLGSRSHASELLKGTRSPSLRAIRLLSKQWRIPPSLLIGEADAA